MSSPLTLSIIIPVYNSAKYIGSTIQSLLPLADDSSIEVIFVNDGSTDASKDIIHQHLPKFATAKYIEQANAGVSVARNNGLSLATGDYIWFVDSDDTIMANQVQKARERLKGRDTELVRFQSVTEYLMGGGKPLLLKPALYTVSDFVTHVFNGAGMLWQYWIKRSAINTNHITFYEGAKWFEDAHFLMKLFCHIGQVQDMDETIYRYFIRKDGAMRNSLIIDRHFCSVRLNIDFVEYVNRVQLEKRLRKALLGRSAISMAWCIREASDDYSVELYNLCRQAHMFPLVPFGTWKQRLQIIMLNINYRLYRKLCKLI